MGCAGRSSSRSFVYTLFYAKLACSCRQPNPIVRRSYNFRNLGLGKDHDWGIWIYLSLKKFTLLDVDRLQVMEATDESVSNSSAENITPLTNGNAHTEAGDEELERVSNTDNEDEKVINFFRFISSVWKTSQESFCFQTSSPKAEIAERAVDSEGWEDLLGSGRLRKRVIKEGDPEHHPAKGHQVKIRFKGKGYCFNSPFLNWNPKADKLTFIF